MFRPARLDDGRCKGECSQFMPNERSSDEGLHFHGGIVSSRSCRFDLQILRLDHVHPNDGLE